MAGYKEYFKGKKVTVMGLGLLGRALGDAEFMAKCGADLIVTDLKSSKELAPSVKKLKKYKNIKFVLDGHNISDFENRDFILKAAGVSLDSPYIAHAKKKNIPVEMSACLFARLANLPIIGVTGTRGKSTVTHMIAHILKSARRKFILGGNVAGVSTLALLPKAKNSNLALFELDSWQLQGFSESSLSPNISIFTTFLPDHMNYYNGSMEKYFEDKSAIFKNQKREDNLILGEQVMPYIKEWGGEIKSNISVPPAKLPKGFSIVVPGEHNLYNATLAMTVARVLGIKDNIIKKALKNFKGVSGRLEFLREVKGVTYYNDTTATMPEATIVALRALGKNKKVILIMGGSDKGLDMSSLLKNLEKYCKAIILLSGSGTKIIKPIVSRLNIFVGEFDDLKSSFEKAKELAKKGDIILLSPAFASFGMFKNEFDRGEQFVKLVKKLK